MHKSRPVTILVKDRKTETPVKGAKVQIRYWYNWYGMGKVLRMPKPDSAVTDSKGVAILQMADFFQETTFTVNDESYSLSDSLIDEGGFTSDDTVANVEGNIVELRPVP